MVAEAITSRRLILDPFGAVPISPPPKPRHESGPEKEAGQYERGKQIDTCMVAWLSHSHGAGDSRR
jgi:hypothetical protein